MQPMALIDDEDEDPFRKEVWFVYRIDKLGGDAVKLDLIDPEFEGFEGLPKKRRAYEKVIRKHAANEDLYMGEVSHLIRVQDEHLGLFEDFIEELIDID